MYTLQLYLRLVGMRVRAQMHDRASFVFDALAAAWTNISAFLTLIIIFNRFDNIGGWDLAEVAFLYGLVDFSFGVMDMVFSGFDAVHFGEQVRLGLLDQFLLRPASLSLQVFAREFLLRRLGRMLQAAMIFGYAISILKVEWTVGKLLFLPVVVISLVAFFGSFFVIGATVTFWTVEGLEVFNIFTYGGSEMMSYPMHIYPLALRRFFTFVIPAIFVAYFPVLFFLDKQPPFPAPPNLHWLAPLAGFGMLAAAGVFWQFGVRHYQSTGT